MDSKGVKQFPADRAGFSLVVTITMMVLLTVVAVGLLGLSAVSLRTSSQEQAVAEARANARLALMLAIGELQSELGPDQRINAPANLAEPKLSGGRQKWVGTWESWPTNATKRPEPKFRRWLVSGPPQDLANASFPAQASDLVSLMRGKDSALMAAPKISLPHGGLAYAVADENSKARVGPSLPAAKAKDFADHLTRYQSPPSGHNLLSGLKAVTRDETHLDRLVSVKTVDLLPGSQTAREDDTTSFTVWSEGLLTDVRNGGFRKDLSLYFQDPNSGSMSKALYQNGASLGINFQELRNFHEVSSRLTYNASSFTHPDGGKLNPDVPCLVGKSGQLEATADPFFTYLRPMVIRCGWFFSAYSILDPATGKYKICIVVDPLVWLWNPFDVNLVMNPGGHLGIRCWGIPYSFTIEAGSTSITKTFRQLDPSISGTFVGLNVATTKPLVMRPGEVLIYGRGRDATDPIDYKKEFDRLYTEAKLGWSSKGGYWIDTGVLADASSPVSISMAPNQEGQASGHNNIMTFGFTVGKLPSSGASPYSYGGLSIGSPDGSLNFTKFPSEMFPSVPVKTFNSAANLTTQQPLAFFSYFARTEKEGSLKSRYLARLNPTALTYAHSAADANTLQSLPFEPLMQPLDNDLGGGGGGFDYDGGEGFFGGSYKSLFGQSYLVTHSVPREPPISLGSFQHALANGLGLSFDTKIRVTGPLQPSITHAIGNSFAPPCIAPDQTTGTFNNVAAVDHSWLANDALWDQWFVSSLATRNAPYLSADQTGTPRSLFEKFAGKHGQSVPLANRHYDYAGHGPDTDVSDLFSGATPKSDAYLKVASLLRIHGAFNINSTDSAAWLAMFGSSHGLQVPVEACNGTTRSWESGKNPLAALLVPKGSAADSDQLTDPSSENQWTGYRDPSDKELQELADAMVEEVRKRGPFLSLADFINRRLVTDPDLASRGALQAALDRSLNKGLESGARACGDAASGVAFQKADAGSQMTHVPGHVKQGDILTSLGTRFSPRSDTFTIRAYGESRSATGALLASARCEAVIQRDADYIDPADQRLTATANLTSEANKRFGRKFTLLAFRWLSQLEP